MSRLLFARPERVALLTVLALMGTAARAVAQDPADSVPRITPRYGTGLLWVEPLPLTPREIAALLSGRSDSQLLDSAITALTQKYLDAMADEVRAQPSALPSWTTTVGDQTLGIDSRFIYLGPLKVPTFLLALLPINVQPNPTQAAMVRKLNSMREDLLTAGRRSANLAEFKDAVRQLREQKEAEAQFEQNRRTPPDSGSRP